ncbi:unnamed protein product [Callosobruchus maculatus]|nr:unnamed protein product [Callosobruchus maculatus]
MVALKALKPDILPLASCIYLVAVNAPTQLELTLELTNRIARQQEGRILALDNVFAIFFYGKQLKFMVQHIETVDSTDSSTIENKFNKLSMKETPDFYIIDRKTKWEIYRDKSTFIKTEIQKESVGIPVGVDKEIQEVQDIMKTCLSKDCKSSCMPHIKSVLLFGNSGTGKTMIANYLASASKANTVSISAPDLYSIQSNSIEENIKKSFRNAIENSPSVIIIDEIDVLCPQRSSRLNDSEKRIVSTLLLQLDGLKYM